MIHEFKEIIHQTIFNQQKGLKNVLASVVYLEGSSYRKPGVRMLISEDFSSVGAVSGGCVEKEIIRRSTSVFADNKAKLITYDGRYKLGCEGILYVLIEPFFISDEFSIAFKKAYSKRETLKIETKFIKKDESFGDFGTTVTFENQEIFMFSDTPKINLKTDFEVFTQILQPPFRLIIIGAEHDAVKLCKAAAHLGWQIDIITDVKDSKELHHFPGANSVIGSTPETIQFSNIKKNTAVVIMNHSYVKDLKYLIKLTNYQAKYIGILGSTKKRERLFNELFEYVPDISETFFNTIYAPAGLHIGAKTPEEISIAILSEILSVVNQKEPFSLRKINGKIYTI